jgi:hypothetical protein
LTRRDGLKDMALIAAQQRGDQIADKLDELSNTLNA